MPLKMFFGFMLIGSTLSMITDFKIIKEQIEGAYINFHSKCLAKYLGLQLSRDNIVLYRPEGEKSSCFGNNEVFHVIKTLQLTRKYKIEIRTPVYQRCKIKDSFNYDQYIFCVKTPNSLRKILNFCLCRNWISLAQLIILVPENSDVRGMLKVLKDHTIYKASVVMTLDDGTLLVWNAASQCSEMRQIEDNQTFLCNLTQGQLTNYNPFQTLMCPIKMGLRLLSPYAFKLETGSWRRHGLEIDYFGIERAVAGHIVGSDNHLTFSDNHVLGEVYENGTGYGLLKELHDNKIDIIGGALPMPKKLFVGINYPHCFENLVVVVKKRVNFNFLSMLGVFPLDVWGMIFAALIAFTICIYGMHKKISNDGVIRNLGLFLSLYAVLLGKDVKIRQILRLPYISWIWFSFFLRVSFEVLLIYLLTNKDADYQIETLDELCQGSGIVLVLESYKPYTVNGLDLPSCKIPANNFKVCENPLMELDTSDVKDRVGVLIFKRDYEMRLEGILDKPEIPYHIIKEHIQMVPFVFYLRRGDPFMDVFFRRSIMARDHGFIQYYEKASDTYHDINLMHKFRGVTKTIGLTMKNEMLVFLMYTAGVYLSILVFIAEVFYYKFSKQKKGLWCSITYRA